MDWSRCLLCQSPSQDNLKCPALSKNKKDIAAYDTFLIDLQECRSEGIVILEYLTQDLCSTAVLSDKKAKWHKNCRRKFRKDRVQHNLPSTSSNESSVIRNPRSSGRSGDAIQKLCLFCTQEATWKRPLHEFQKLSLTEEVKQKALAMNETQVLNSVSLGDLVANELKYHTNCIVEFRRRYDVMTKEKHTLPEDTAQHRAFEEVLAMIDENISAGRTHFSLKDLHEEACSRKLLHGNSAGIDRTELKKAVLERYPELREEPGFGRSIMLVTTETMKDLVTTSVSGNRGRLSSDYQTLAKAALICRREITRHITDKDVYSAEKDGFPADCQNSSVPEALKFLVGMLIHGPSCDTDTEAEQSTLSLAQLILFNCSLKIKHARSSVETPLPVYIGLFLHSHFRSKMAVSRFAQLGLSIKFNRVQYLERKLAHSALTLFSKEGTVTPLGLRRGLFTVSAVDNIDHNPSSTTSKESFHGTAISMFQSRSTMNAGKEREISKLDSCFKTMKLPDEYTNVQELSVSLNNVPLQKFSMITNNDQDSFLNEILKEEEWAKSVISCLKNFDNNNEDLHITWSAYHGNHGAEVIPSLSGLFPLFKQSSNDPAMILHAMKLVIKSTAFLNQGQVPVITGDQPVYASMKKLQWALPQKVGNMVVMLGGFHLEKQALICLGDLLEGSGWSTAIAEAGIATTGTADALLKATHVTKSRYSHQVTYIAMTLLLHEAHQECAPDMSLEEWTTSMTDAPTFNFWLLILKFQKFVFTFIRAQRNTDFSLYLECLQNLAPLFFSADHIKYARCVSIHIQDLKELPESIYKEFKEGNFVVKRSSKRFSAIAIDQSHEQMNKIVKSSGGVIGLTQDPTSLIKWSLCNPLVNQMLEDFWGDYSDKNSDFFHHDEGNKQQIDFFHDVQNLTDVIRSRGNPFLENGEDLINLDGKYSNDKHSVSRFEKQGQEQFSNFVKNVLLERKTAFEDPIKKNFFSFFKCKKAIKRKSKKVQMLKHSSSLFSQMYIATNTREGDLDLFFSHEVHAFPPSMAESEEVMYSTKKSEIIHCLEKAVSESNKTISVDQTMSHDSLIVDGGALIHMLVPGRGITTFSDYKKKCFKKYIECELRKVPSLHIVWDTYKEVSIKDATRSARGTGVRIKVDSNVKIPGNWAEFLRDSKNKEELFKFLGDNPVDTQSISGDLYISSADGKTVKHWGRGENMEGQFCKEEADSRMVPHILHALKIGHANVLVRTCDSDVVVILLYHFPLFEATSVTGCEVYISYGTGKHNRILSIRAIVEAIGQKFCSALPLLHAVTGCDSTSAFKGRSKRMCFNALRKCSDEIIEAMGSFQPFIELRLDSQLFTSLEHYIVKVYGGDTDIKSVNQLRRQIFCQRNQNIEMIPPTQNALYHHCQRAIYQSSIWISAHDSQVHEPDPCLFGWKESDGKLRPQWISVPQIASVCQELVKCGCKKPCSRACSCFKKGLPCTGLCKCVCSSL